MIWYAAYGSNLSADRFRTYLSGGVAPHLMVDRSQSGARDPRPPAASRSWELPHRVFFAAESSERGGGAMAFLDPTTEFGQRCLARLWLITAEQFEDVYRQANGLPVPPPGRWESERLFDVDTLAAGDRLDVTERRYGRLVHLGPGPAGHPIATCTGADPGRYPLGPADPSYLRTMGIGLMERFRFKPGGAAKYLAERDGNAGNVDRKALTADLARWVPPS